MARAAPARNSSYNIRMGRSRKVTGPFLDNMGIDMLQGGGKLFAGSSGRHIGPGHFGLLDLGDGVQKFSCHYESDLDRGGISVLDIRPLLWRDGWPVAGDNVTAGTYEIESARTGTALEMAVQGVPVGGARGAGRSRRSRRRDRRRTRRHAATARRFQRRTPRKSEQLAGRPGRCPHGALHAAGPAEVGDHACRQRRRLSRVALLQDHHRRHRARACRDGGRRAHRRCPCSPADPNNSGASISSTDGSYRLMPKARAEREGAAGALRDRQQHAHAREVQRRRAIASAGCSRRHDAAVHARVAACARRARDCCGRGRHARRRSSQPPAAARPRRRR